MIAIIDYGIGNLAAVANMLKRMGVPCMITRDACAIRSADRLILPGNGSFDACVLSLRASNLIPVIEDMVLHEGVPCHGICVGAQMLGLSSEEGREAGLGWIKMTTRKFRADGGLKVPHMGWNEVRVARATDSIAASLEPASRFYFVHSYYMRPDSEDDILLVAKYGHEFAAAVRKNNITGVQFHPEKSHRFGKALLRGFVGGI